MTWPNGNNLVIYNASNNLVENTISYGRSVGRGLLIQANDDTVQAVGNRVLGAMVAATGMNWDGTEHEFGTTRPGLHL
ncbi:MAG: hypothetical protein IPK16_11375 [Anaerolineales bacterium]|nr:hypothetical protein [Anaerolineales bacterium]